mgnify:FL=1
MIDKLAVYVLTYHKHSQQHLERCFWSIENQPTELKYDVVVNYNSTVPEQFEVLKEFVPEEYTLIETKSDGFTGKGVNSCVDHYLENCETNSWTHMCIIDGDDYYYPMAFDILNELHEKTDFDYLSGMAHHVDSLRPAPPHRDDPRKVYPYQPKRWLWSFVDNRLPVYPYLFWNGETIPGGEVTLCMSTKAVQSDIRALEGENRVDDYFFMLKAVIAHLGKKINFVSTDCNDIYVYDCTQDSITRGTDDFDEERGWPFDKNGLVYSEVNKEEYKTLAGITRQHLPYATMPQVWTHELKCQFVAGNEIA